MPVFGETLYKFLKVLPDAKFILSSTPEMYQYTKQYLEFMPTETIFLSPEKIGMEKYLIYKRVSFNISDIALAASGTVSLELAANSTPMVIGYDMNYLSRQIIRFMLKTDTITLINLITDNRNVPECIGQNCNAENLFLEMVRTYSQSDNQKKDFLTTMNLLGKGNKAPNIRAAESIIKFYQSFIENA